MTPLELNEKTVETLKAEAVEHLDQMFGVPNGFYSSTRIVDCIVGAAVLEITSVIKAGYQEKE